MKLTAGRFITLALAVVLLLGLFAPVTSSPLSASPAHAQAACWNALYYNDTSFAALIAANPCVTATGDGGLVDTFSAPGTPTAPPMSARYTRFVTFPSTGTYNLTAFVNDGVRINIGGQMVINDLNDSPSPRSLGGSFTINSTGQSVTIELVNSSGAPTINVSWALVSGTGGTGGTGGTTTCITTPSFVSPWTVAYYNTTDFSGPVVASGSFGAGALAVNYGAAAPAAGVNLDNWSAQFTRLVDFQPGGSVKFTMTVDDTGAVYLDGNVVTVSDVVYRGDLIFEATVNVTPGSHTIRVDMRDLAAEAFINVTWTGAETGGGGTCGTTGTGGTTVNSPTGVVGTVTANVGLNFRQCPDLSCTKITKLDKGTSWAVLGRTADSVWAQLDVNGTIGWSLASWLSFTGDFNTVPVTVEESTLDTELPDGVPIRAVGNVRVRSCPSLRCERLSYVPWGTQVSAVGRTANGYWVKIGYNDPELGVIVGWSYALWYFNNDFTLPLPELPIIAE